MADSGIVYCLLEPDSYVIRYVGQTRRRGGLQARIDAHLDAARRRAFESNHRLTWLRKLDADGLRPRGEVLATVPVQDLDSSERHWIKLFRSYGFDLVNGTDGGTGGSTRRGMKTPPETARKQGLAALGRRHTEQSRQKIREGRAADRTYPRSCLCCRRVFWGYMALRNHLTSPGFHTGASCCLICGVVRINLSSTLSHRRSHQPRVYKAAKV